MARGELTDRQARFVEEYLLDLNATQAAIRAGYSDKSACRIGAELLQKTQVCEAIQKSQERRAARVCRKADDVLRDIQEVTREAREKGDQKTALKGLELEGKHIGMFKERVEAEITGGLVFRWEK